MEIKKGQRPGSPPSPGHRAGGVGTAGRSLNPGTLELVRERDPGALTELFEAFFDRVFGLAYRLLGERTAAEDAVQDVFVKIYGAAHRLDPARDPGPWIITITYNVCRDFWRSRRHRMDSLSSSLDEHPGLGDAASLASDPGGPDLVRREREQKVQEAIAALPEPLRSVVVLHDYQGLGHDEIASIVGASHAAVRKRYSRALGRLGELLKDLSE